MIISRKKNKHTQKPPSACHLTQSRNLSPFKMVYKVYTSCSFTFVALTYILLVFSLLIASAFICFFPPCLRAFALVITSVKNAHSSNIYIFFVSEFYADIYNAVFPSEASFSFFCNDHYHLPPYVFPPFLRHNDTQRCVSLRCTC